ncbi:MAG: response regulator [Pseudomonadota bacterium]
MSPLALLVEDDQRLADVLGAYYAKEIGGRWHHLTDGGDLLPFVAQEKPDVVLLDLMLPGVDGLTLCRQLREHSEVPVIMLTARVEESDRILGLEAGADDYVCKPFSPREVMARVKAQLRRAGFSGDAGAEPLRVNGAAMKVTYGRKEKALTPAEMNLLETLAARPGRIYRRDELMDRMHADFRDVTDRSVDSHVRNLRRKLEALGASNTWVETVYGVGYRFTDAAPVTLER